MNSYLLKSLAAIVCLLCSITVSAQDFEVDGIYYNITSETKKTVEVTCYQIYSNDYIGLVVIPETVTYSGIKYSVTSIGNLAFCCCTGLTEVTIPNSVTSIGEYAFSECTGLTEVTIPNSVTSIGEYAFYYCDGLTEVTIPNSVTSIGEYAFSECTGLTEVTIPNSVTSIGDGAFSGCTELISIVVEKGNTVYDSRENCNAIIETTTNTLITGCKNTIIPNSVTSIGDIAFSSCTGLTEVTIPNSVTSIGEYAFYCCIGLTEVTIPNSVTSIGEFAFSGCNKLSEIVVKEDNTVYDSRENCNAIIETTTNTLLTGCQNTIIPNSVTSIGEYAFYYCDGLIEVTIPNSVTGIGEYAFCFCTGLTEVTIPNSVTSIGKRAFCCCTGLTEIAIPNSVTSIGECAFYCCTGLTEVTIPNSVTSIGYSAFSYCTGLKTVIIGSGVQEIGFEAFYDCDRIEDVYAYPTVPPTIYVNTFSSYNATLHTAKGYKDVYAEAPYWEYFTNITDDLTSVEGVRADDAFSVTVVGGTLAITGAADNAVVNIYNTNGAFLHHTTVAQASGIALPSGIYLVQVNGVTKKVAL